VGSDEIISVDGKQVKGFADSMTYLVRSTDVGQKTSLAVWSQRTEETGDITLAARPRG
jgi:S1-C subfamily serine protease